MNHDRNQELVYQPEQMQAAEQLPADLMLVKMEGEHIMTMATQRRMPMAQVIKEACDLLEAYPEAAQQAVYSKPVGLKPDRCKACKHERQRKNWERFDPRCDKCGGKNSNMVEGKMTYARGLSIRAMESLSSLTGFNRVAATETKVSDGLWKVTAIFIDYARGIIRSDESLVSQFKPKKGGGTYKEEDGRFTEMTLKAAKSKVKRNAIRDALPFELRQAYEQKSIEVSPRFLTAEKIQAIIGAFESQGVYLSDLNNLLRREKADKWTAADAETMRGIWTALENGEMSVDELLLECRPPADALEDMTEKPTGKSAGKSAPKSAGDAVTDELTGQQSTEPEEPAEPAPRTRRPSPAKSPQVEPQADAKPQAKPSGGKSAEQAEPEEPSAATAAKPAPARPESKPAAAAVTGPVGSPVGDPPPRTEPQANNPAANNPPASMRECVDYIRDNYPDEIGVFDSTAICRRAIGQPKPFSFIDLILKRQNPNWANFLLPQDSGDDFSQAPADEVSAEDFPAEEIQDEPAAEDSQADQIPECVTNPLARPADMSIVAEACEKQIQKYRQAKRIKDLLDGQVRENTALTNEESAYLIDLGERTAWELEHPKA